MAVARAILTVIVVLLGLVIASGAVGLGLPPSAGMLSIGIVAVPVVGHFLLIALTVTRPPDASLVPTATVGRLRLLRVKAETYLDDAIVEAERLLRLEPRDPQVADELTRLYIRAGRTADARRVAALAIERALTARQGAMASEIVRRFGEERAALGLRPPLLERLGWALVQQGDFDTATWAFDALAAAGGSGPGDPERVHKGLVA